MERGLTQTHLAELSKISRRTIIRWEAGKASPWIPELRSVADAMKMTSAEFEALIQRLDTNRARHETDQALSVGKLLRAVRLRSGRTAEEVASVLGCDPSTVARWESGRSYADNADLQLLSECLQLYPNEVEEFKAASLAFQIDSDLELQERLLGIVWPWDPLAFRLYDARFLGLLGCLDSSQALSSVRSARTVVAYAWMLSASGRFREAADYLEPVLGFFEAGEIPAGRYLIAASIICARSLLNGSTQRGWNRGMRLLDELEGRPLTWELLACRYDAYCEAHTLRSDFAAAAKWSTQAISAAEKSGGRLAKHLRFNRCRLHLLSGAKESALKELPPFSESTPFVDAGEALTLAAIYSAQGYKDRSAHFQSVADGLIGAFCLQEPLRSQPLGAWGAVPITAVV